MKASEVLNRYANGELDFRRANLRGQSFKGQDLSGADFSEADIRGANFTNAVLNGAHFTKATAGVQKRWMLGQLLLLFVLSTLAGVLQGYFGWYIAAYFPRWWDSTYDWRGFTIDLTVTIACFITITTVLLAIARQGFTAAAASTIAIASAGVGAGAGVVAVIGTLFGTLFGAGSGAVAVISAIASAVAGAIAGAFAGAGAVIGAVAVAGVGAVIGAVAVAGMVAGTGAIAGTIAGEVIIAVTGAVTVAGTSLLLGIYCSRQSLKGNRKFALLRILGIAFGSLGGTSFCGTNLTEADFTQATLKSTNFHATHQQPTLLTHTCWNDAKQLDRARLGDSILSHAAVRELLVTRNGYKKAYVDANLRGANLNGVNLNAANLKGADLSNATLQQADLRDANLREVLAIGTDFTGASLTGACLEAWNIDHTTILKDIDCQYVFLLEHANALGSRDRRPHEPDQVFAPGDFERLYTKMMNVVQVLLRNGMNRTAFAEAFQQLINEHPDISYESIQAVERKGNDALVTLEVSATTDKAEISRSLRESYDSKVKQLEAKVETLHQLRAADLKEVALAQKAQFFNQLVGGNAMQENTDQSRNINVTGNVTGSTFNLGAISGSVTNTINQLQAANPQAAELADRLRQLQRAIEADPDLQPDDKTEALEQVGTLAKAGENPQDGTLKKLAATSVKILKGTIATLPSTATIVKACSDLLPAITKLLGL